MIGQWNLEAQVLGGDAPVVSRLQAHQVSFSARRPGTDRDKLACCVRSETCLLMIVTEMLERSSSAASASSSRTPLSSMATTILPSSAAISSPACRSPVAAPSLETSSTTCGEKPMFERSAPASVPSIFPRPSPSCEKLAPHFRPPSSWGKGPHTSSQALAALRAWPSPRTQRPAHDAPLAGPLPFRNARTCGTHLWAICQQDPKPLALALPLRHEAKSMRNEWWREQLGGRWRWGAGDQ